jgi:16S rRNA (cytosine1402-N4)-methyltransferase
MSETYHIPVMLSECIDALNIRPDGVYVDVTFGGGGHSRAILEKLGPEGKLYAFDQDEDAKKQLPDDQRIVFIQQNFRYIKKMLRLERVTQIDGLLADLGVSSHHFDEAERGFSYRFEAELDMRMNQNAELSAQHILARYPEDKLVEIFSKYGEVRNAKTLAHTIVTARAHRKIKTTTDLLEIIDTCIMGTKNRYLAQLFQALRMEVNDEVGALCDMIVQTTELLKPGGRFVVMSYHSIEDRLVKHYMKKGNFEGVDNKDFYGNISRPYKLVTNKPVEASAAEQKSNPRSRSARLRVAEKL